jgi:hypothetical protein
MHGRKGRGDAKLLQNLTLCPVHHLLLHLDQWHLVYCFADAAHADFFREKFGSETFNPHARGVAELTPIAIPAPTENIEGHP